MNGLSFAADSDDIHMTVTYTQAKFDELIVLFTQFAKSVSGQEAAPKKELPAEKQLVCIEGKCVKPVTKD